MSIGQELLNVPMGEMIREMAIAIADAQIKLDENSIEVAEMMGGLKTVYDEQENVTFEDSRVFFGREKVTLQSAVDLYNSTSSEEVKTRLETDVLGPNGSNKNDVSKDIPTDKYTVKTPATNPPDPNQLVSIATRLSMMELGFSPTFYQFVDTIIEVNLSISMTREYSSEVKVDSKSKGVRRSASLSWQKGKIDYSQSKTVTTTNVNATYASKYSYSAEGSSLLRTKLTPIPPPPILEERIRQLMEDFN